MGCDVGWVGGLGGEVFFQVVDGVGGLGGGVLVGGFYLWWWGWGGGGLTCAGETLVMLAGKAAGVVLSAVARRVRAEIMKARVKSMVADGEE